MFLRPFTLPPPPAKDLPGFHGFVEQVKPILPIPVLLIILPIGYLLLRGWWRDIDETAARDKAAIFAKGDFDRRPLVALVMCALILTMQEYYGGRAFFDQTVYPMLFKYEQEKHSLSLVKYDELYGFAWWAITRIGGYVLPFMVWRFFFWRDSLLDFGLRTKGFFDHAWIYLLFLGVVLPPMFVVASAPDFGAYYPFYKTAHRSWFDFLTWEAMYFAQFFALEMFFRGFWLGALRRSFGSGAILAMAVPYCMIHFGKPYLEAIGAVLAGIALGSVSMKTKSIYQGFLVHITVAALMDWLSLRRRHCTPLVLWPSASGGGTCLQEAPLRDALATKIEYVAIPVLALVVVFFLVMYVRSRVLRERRYL